MSQHGRRRCKRRTTRDLAAHAALAPPARVTVSHSAKRLEADCQARRARPSVGTEQTGTALRQSTGRAVRHPLPTCTPPTLDNPRAPAYFVHETSCPRPRPPPTLAP